MTIKDSIVAIWAARINNNRPGAVEHPNCDFASWDFWGRTNPPLPTRNRTSATVHLQELDTRAKERKLMKLAQILS